MQRGAQGTALRPDDGVSALAYCLPNIGPGGQNGIFARNHAHPADAHTPSCSPQLITLIGPGGAGKSTVGVLIAKRLGIAFVDLDQRFGTRAGDISDYIERFGYDAYARENVETYDSLLHEGTGPLVAALSSGFMSYPRDIHPQYAGLRRDIEESPTTFVLIPSVNGDTCVAETVRRQLARPFARPAAREEAVIRERFPIYVGLRARKIETMGPLTAIVEELLIAIEERAPSSASRTAPRPSDRAGQRLWRASRWMRPRSPGQDPDTS